jgi:hypothetical protein
MFKKKRFQDLHLIVSRCAAMEGAKSDRLGIFE